MYKKCKYMERIVAAARHSMRRRGNTLLFFVFPLTVVVMHIVSCERNPELHLHRGGNISIDLPVIELELSVLWDYEIADGIPYDWKEEWYYGWDDTDRRIFGELGYTKPEVFNIRRYFTGQVPYDVHSNVLADQIRGYTYEAAFNWGYWDILAWNHISTIDGVQSLVFDEISTLEYVTASTNQTLHPSRYQAPRFTRSFYQPEGLFSAYNTGIEINRNLDGFVYDEDRRVWVKKLEMVLEPCTYIYLTQVILHHNAGRITSVDGSGNLSGMARSVNLNTGIAGSDSVTVYYNVRLKPNCTMKTEKVDIVGGRLMTFGMCNVNGSRVGQKGRSGETITRVDDGVRHYMDVTMQFYNGMDSTFVFDVTDQVRKRYKGGVLTVELDMDTVPIPQRSGGSGFDAVVKDFEDGGTHEFEM